MANQLAEKIPLLEIVEWGDDETLRRRFAEELTATPTPERIRDYKFQTNCPRNILALLNRKDEDLAQVADVYGVVAVKLITCGPYEMILTAATQLAKSSLMEAIEIEEIAKLVANLHSTYSSQLRSSLTAGGDMEMSVALWLAALAAAINAGRKPAVQVTARPDAGVVVFRSTEASREPVRSERR